MVFPQISGVFSVPRLQLSTLRPALGVAQMHQLFTLRAAWLREIPGLLVELLMGKNHRKILENLTIKWRFQWDINYI